MRKRNSVKQLIEVLERKPLLTETKLFKKAFNYVRGKSIWEPNKKYADMLRRGLKKGIISRVCLRVKGSRSIFFYYIPK